MRVQGFLIYRIWYGNCLVYVGRTKQPLQSRIRGHLFSKPMHRTVNIEQVTKIEYAELGSEADMNLYEIYYILRLHPPLNVDDKARDDLRSLPMPQFLGNLGQLFFECRESFLELVLCDFARLPQAAEYRDLLWDLRIAFPQVVDARVLLRNLLPPTLPERRRELFPFQLW